MFLKVLLTVLMGNRPLTHMPSTLEAHVELCNSMVFINYKKKHQPKLMPFKEPFTQQLDLWILDQAGIKNASITWITPLVHSMSVALTLIAPFNQTPLVVLTLTEAPSRVSTRPAAVTATAKVLKVTAATAYQRYRALNSLLYKRRQDLQISAGILCIT
jgi:hypothetical protein